MEMYSDRNQDCWYKEVCLADMSLCNRNCIKFMEIQHLMETSGLPKARQCPQQLIAPDWDLEAYTRLAEIKDDIVNFVEQGKNLYIASGMSGNGKTSWAIKLLLRYFDQIWSGNGFNTRGLFISVPTFLLKAKDFKHTDDEFERLKRNILKADLVIWDDIASTTMSAYDYSQILVYLDNRLLAKQSNIYTGNFPTVDMLSERVGTKVASRIFSHDTEVITFKGGDMR